jgi:hypothetical protein
MEHLLEMLVGRVLECNIIDNGKVGHKNNLIHVSRGIALERIMLLQPSNEDPIRLILRRIKVQQLR